MMTSRIIKSTSYTLLGPCCKALRRGVSPGVLESRRPAKCLKCDQISFGPALGTRSRFSAPRTEGSIQVCWAPEHMSGAGGSSSAVAAVAAGLLSACSSMEVGTADRLPLAIARGSAKRIPAHHPRSRSAGRGSAERGFLHLAKHRLFTGTDALGPGFVDQEVDGVSGRRNAAGPLAYATTKMIPARSNVSRDPRAGRHGVQLALRSELVTADEVHRVANVYLSMPTVVRLEPSLR